MFLREKIVHSIKKFSNFVFSADLELAIVFYFSRLQYHCQLSSTLLVLVCDQYKHFCVCGGGGVGVGRGLPYDYYSQLSISHGQNLSQTADISK